jgi:hypothetical protein
VVDNDPAPPPPANAPEPARYSALQQTIATAMRMFGLQQRNAQPAARQAGG